MARVCSLCGELSSSRRVARWVRWPAPRDHLDRWTPEDDTASVFVGEPGGPLGSVSLQTCFDEARVATGLTEFTLHDLRHAAGTMAASTGATKELMARLDHSTQDASLRYQHTARTGDAEIVAKIHVIRLADLQADELVDKLTTDD